MSVAQFSKDLTKPGEKDEPKESSNAGMNAALILAVLLSIFTVFVGIYGPAVHHQLMQSFPSTQSVGY
ncbi:MAG: hypothetical protein P4L53_15505 [Candidatus Obscuribacterales bacterium]|nr:hypothetical protein [Candidatus Obscuribacterales bacterium]